MEMPVICKRCENEVELNSTRESPLTSVLLCANCYEKDSEVNDLIEEAKDIHYDLENDAEYMKGDRRGWKKNLKELKAEISKLGYNLDDYLIF